MYGIDLQGQPIYDAEIHIALSCYISALRINDFSETYQLSMHNKTCVEGKSRLDRDKRYRSTSRPLKTKTIL